MQVVLTNQMTTKVSRGRGQGERTSAQLVPALGDSHTEHAGSDMLGSGREGDASNNIYQ